LLDLLESALDLLEDISQATNDVFAGSHSVTSRQDVFEGGEDDAHRDIPREAAGVDREIRGSDGQRSRMRPVSVAQPCGVFE